MARTQVDYGNATECEYPGCDRPRGAPKRSLMRHGCVLCSFHSNQYQLGKISLPESASVERKARAERDILG